MILSKPIRFFSNNNKCLTLDRRAVSHRMEEMTEWHSRAWARPP